VVRVRREQLPGNLYEGQAPNKTPIWQSKQQSQTHQWKPVWVRLSENERFVEDLRTSPQQGFKEGRLVITGDVPRKKKEFVFLLPEATDEKLDVPDTLIELFHNDDQLTQWQESAFPTNQPRQGYRQRAGMIGSNPLAPGEPVFFLRERSQLAFMGRAQMFRLPYHRTPHDLVPLYLHDTKQIDYADALFGYIKHGTENNQSGIRQGNKYLAYASRVSVTNASLMGEPENIWLSDRAFAPKILASPKPSAFQHYLTQQEPDTKRELDHYGSPPHETTLRGHKLYWHQGSRQRSDLEDQNVPNNSTQHTQFRPVREGAQFKFRIHFENLSNRELGALCWVLHPVGPEEQDYCHSLGMGKPLGMGAVKLEASLHLTNRSKRYSALFAADDWEMGLSSQIENLGTRATLLKRTKPFENHILSELAPEPTCKHLYELKRIAILLKMLEWPGFPSQPNGLLHLGSRPNTRYMAIQPNEYRDRPVLPDPSAFGVLTGESKPIVAVFMDKKAKGNWTQDEAACERDLETWIVSLYTEGDTKEAERKSTQIIQLAQKHVTKLNIKKLIEKVQSRL
jgi:CRISPR-associated protein (TIGR03986 family)